MTLLIWGSCSAPVWRKAQAAADYITRARGGHGAVREVAELILKAQDKWTRVVAESAA